MGEGMAFKWNYDTNQTTGPVTSGDVTTDFTKGDTVFNLGPNSGNGFSMSTLLIAGFGVLFFLYILKRKRK